MGQETTSLPSSSIPSGGIIMWSGPTDSIPQGWYLCDGNNGTPDLQDRFVVGAGNQYSTDDTGGSDSVQLKNSELPSHDHSLLGQTTTDGSHSHDFNYEASPDGSVYSLWSQNIRARSRGEGATFTTLNSGNHSHDLTGNTDMTGSDEAHENRPPYYALAYIMKA